MQQPVINYLGTLKLFIWKIQNIIMTYWNLIWHLLKICLLINRRLRASQNIDFWKSDRHPVHPEILKKLIESRIFIQGKLLWLPFDKIIYLTAWDITIPNSLERYTPPPPPPFHGAHKTHSASMDASEKKHSPAY